MKWGKSVNLTDNVLIMATGLSCPLISFHSVAIEVLHYGFLKSYALSADWPAQTSLKWLWPSTCHSLGHDSVPGNQCCSFKLNFLPYVNQGCNWWLVLTVSYISVVEQFGNYKTKLDWQQSTAHRVPCIVSAADFRLCYMFFFPH